MDFLINSLSSLTHSTPITHTKPSHTSDAVDAADNGDNDDGDDGTVAEDTDRMMDDAVVEDGRDNGLHSHSAEAMAELKRKFNMEEFLALAHRVIDDGDEHTMNALQGLKHKWEATIGPVRTAGRSSIPMTVAENPWAQGFSLARRTVNPTRRLLPTVPLPTAPGTDSARSIPNQGVHNDVAVPNPNLHGAPPRVFGGDTPTPSPAGPSSAVHSGNATALSRPQTEASGLTPTGLFVGNIPLHGTPSPYTPASHIADGFNNYTRKTLRYIPPERQNGEVVVRPTIDMINEGSRKWETMAVGYFLGRKTPFHQVPDYVHSIWPVVRDVTATATGFFFITFKTYAAMEEVIEGDPWLFQGQPIVLQKWVLGMALCKHGHTQVPIWIKLRHLPVELWTADGLSTVASGTRRSLYPDAITKTCTRLDFARVCVMIDFNASLPKHVVVVTPREDGRDHPCRVDVEYEWPTVQATEDRVVTERVEPARVHTSPLAEVSTNSNIDTESKGKELMVYNPFSVLTLIDTDEPNEGGPNTSSPDDDFLDLLETRVAFQSTVRVQNNVKRDWNWFCDHSGPGNRIWLMWDESELDITVLLVHPQCIHCRVFVKRTHDTSLITVVYGSNDGYDVRRSKRLFRFDNYLAAAPGFLDSVKNVRQHHIYGIPMYALTRKLKNLKPTLQAQRKRKGDLTANVEQAKMFLDKIQRILILARHDDLLLQLEHVTRLAECYGHVVTVEEGILKPITREEVKIAVFDIAEDKAPGSDGFSSGFFKAAWPLIGDEVTLVMQDFFNSGKLLRQINATLITLTLKWLHRVWWANFALLRAAMSFTRAEVQSVQLFRDSLMMFAEWSGLEANPSKSQISVSKAAWDVKQQLLNVLGFREGTLPVRYLGVPLISSWLTAGDCAPLLRKVDERLQGWGKLQLSFAAQVQLLRSVIMSLNIYWAMAFVLAKSVIKVIEARIRRFLWHGNFDSGMAKVAQKDVCKPLEEGGQGLKSLKPLNKDLMSKHFWSVVMKDQSSIWVTWILTYRLKHGSIWTTSPTTGSWGWRKIVRLRTQLLGHILYTVGMGANILLWHDPWHKLGVLLHRFPRGPQIVGIPLDATLQHVIRNGNWDWPEILDVEHNEIIHRLPVLNAANKISWNSPTGQFTNIAACQIWQPRGSKVLWHHLLTGSLNIPRNSFILWLAILGTLSTLDRAWWHGPDRKPIITFSLTVTLLDSA
ncbi:UNVERIFIED_CONTAM: hypothetical protein Slati_1677200 [Sesamum latifolium]|uniref:DUF4283 domain-containing protein n=1 Tax=Sesamum latifolium TaxID=2727402 RepID=A0AAW2WVM6_9LAMI